MPGLIQSSPVMRITHSFEGTESVFESAASEVVVGRAREGLRIDLDLSPDQSVSRPHARIAVHDGECFLEDLGSRHGTFVNGADIKGRGRIKIAAEDEVVEMLNSCFAELVEILFKYDGTFDKFMGDAILAVFGSPVPDDKQQEKAVRAAGEMQARIQKANAARKARGLACCEVGIGIHSGQVVHGFVGSETRMEFTVIGEGVNLATRYCEAADAGEILISPQVFEHVWKLVESDTRTIHTKHGDSLEAHLVRGLHE